MNTDIKPSQIRTMNDLLMDVPDNQHIESFSQSEIVSAIPRIKIEGSEFIIPGQENLVKTFDCVIIHSQRIRGYFKEDSDKVPVCHSRDMQYPLETSTERQNPTCPECKWNKFGSAEKGSGKRCSETIQVFLVLYGENISNQVMSLHVRPMSFRNWQSYGIDISSDDRAMVKNLICWITNVEIIMKRGKIGDKDITFATYVFNRFQKKKDSAPLEEKDLEHVLRIRAGYIDLIRNQIIANPADDVVNEKAEAGAVAETEQTHEQKQVIDYSDIEKVEDY